MTKRSGCARFNETGPSVSDVMADVANYTNIAPVTQISEVVN